MIVLGAGTRDRPLLGPSTHARHVPNDPPPRPDTQVQGVVVTPPRDSRVAVRVEIVTEAQRRESRENEGTASQTPSPYDVYANRDTSWFPVAAAEPQAAATSARFGAADARTAAAAYRAHADWQSSGPAERPSEPPRHLSVRA